MQSQPIARAGKRADVKPRGVAIPGTATEDDLVDTTHGSVLHRWVQYGGRLPTAARVYAACVALTYLPALIAASWILKPDVVTRLPFLLDWNFTFTFLVSFPTLVLLIVSDEHVLALALQRVWVSGVISRDVADSRSFAQKWTARFGWANTYAYTFGLVLGAGLSWLTLRVYVWTAAGFWAAPAGTVGLIGFLYLACITLLYAVIAVFVTRSVMIAFFLGELVKLVTVRLLPFHPDGCGGLQPAGRLGLRNQYTLTILGLNIAILGVVTVRYLASHTPERELIATAVLAYAVLGPVVFMAPLLPFRAAMLRSKAVLMGELSDRLRIDFTKIRSKFQTEGLSAEDLETLERLQKVGAMIEGLPVWPFDARTLRTFASAYVVPFLLPFLEKAVEGSLVLLGLKL